MYQSHYFFKLLLAIALFFCVNAFRPDIAAGQDAPANKRVRLQRIYLSQLGVRERRQLNDGPEVEAYLKYTGLTKGSAWCAAYVCWCLGKAGIPNPRSAWSPSLFPVEKLIWRKERSLLQKFSEIKKPPQAGDVFGIFFPEKNRIAHCGFIDSWTDKWVITVEGNTNERGSREGDGVYRKRRLQQQLYCVATYLQ